MALERGLHGRVLDSLGQRIVDGDVPPGAVLRPEDLAAEFGVSRSVVREALRVLQSLGLVQPRQRIGTQVLDIASWELLAPTVIRWRGASPAYFTQQRELLELRLGIEPVAAALTAGRGAGAGDGTAAGDGTGAGDGSAAASSAAVLAAAEAMVAACDSDDGRAYLEADVRFHRALLGGSGNAVFAHFANTVDALLRTRTSERRDTITEWTRDAAARHLAVGRAVVAGDASAASAAATELVRVTRAEFVAEADGA